MYYEYKYNFCLGDCDKYSYTRIIKNLVTKRIDTWQNQFFSSLQLESYDMFKVKKYFHRWNGLQNDFQVIFLPQYYNISYARLYCTFISSISTWLDFVYGNTRHKACFCSNNDLDILRVYYIFVYSIATTPSGFISCKSFRKVRVTSSLYSWLFSENVSSTTPVNRQNTHRRVGCLCRITWSIEQHCNFWLGQFTLSGIEPFMNLYIESYDIHIV